MSVEIYKHTPTLDKLPDIFSKKTYEKVQCFHESLKGYGETPLVSLENLAKKLGVKAVYVKDESKRFGLNAFKGLGASFAVNEYISEHGVPKGFVTATDGNHGKAVAWSAKNAGVPAVVFMPKGSRRCRIDAIKAQGAEVIVTDTGYDDTVKTANEYAKENGMCLMQDTAFEGYTKAPGDIMLGYTTMAREALQQMCEEPTHVFLQAGVGSMAAGVLGYLADNMGKLPIVTVCEAYDADCVYKSVKNKKATAAGDSDTIMAGLNCGEVSSIALPVFLSHGTFYAKCTDDITVRGMRILAHPLGEDAKVISGESGAVGVGLLDAICSEEALADYKKLMSLDGNSVILCFSTEGDTDPENYKACTEN